MMQLNLFWLYKPYLRYTLVSIVLATLIAGCGGNSSLPADDDPFNPATPITRVTVEAVASDGGSVDPTRITVDSGETATLDLTAADNFRLSSVSGCGGAMISDTQYRTAELTSNCTVNAQFEALATVRVTATATAGGSIEPAAINVQEGTQTQFTVTPYEGYMLAGIIGCDGLLIPENGYRTGRLSADCSIAASFTPEPQEYVSQDFFYAMDDPAVNRASSKHFQMVWGKNDTTGQVDQAFIDGNLANLEAVRNVYINTLGFRDASQSIHPAQRDGRHYKTNVYVTGTGLAEHAEGFAFAGFNDPAGFFFLIVHPSAMRVDPPSWVLPHEYGHVLTGHSAYGDEGGWVNNEWIGPWWESLAEWFAEQYLYSDQYAFNGTKYSPETGFALPAWENAHLFQAHGRDYYDGWFLFQYLHENPDNLDDIGPGFMVKLLEQSTRSENLFQMIDRLAPNVSVQDILGHQAKRMATQDFSQRDLYRAEFQRSLKDPLSYMRSMTELKRVSDKPDWWQVPRAYAPQATGFNVIKLIPEGTEVRVDFRGLANDALGADWRAAIVATDINGNTRYSSLWNNGENSLSVDMTDEVYLTVAATPTDIPNVSAFAGEVRMPFESHAAKARYPYEVKISGARPFEKSFTLGNQAGSLHTYGGGFVADSATVESTAYVGPNAVVLGNAQVLGNARVEDFAVIENEAIVRGNAIVSGHARLRNRAIVEDNARVRDYAIVRDSVQVQNNAVVMQQSFPGNNSRIYGNSIVKGSAVPFGDSAVSGEAIVDGDYAGDLTLVQGNVFGWLSNQQYADNQPHTPGVVLSYDFIERSQSLALDKYGVHHGILRGAPTINSNNKLLLNGQDQYVVVDDFIMDVDRLAIETSIRWDGGAQNQRVWTLGSADDKQLYLTSANAAGVVSVVLRYQGETYEVASNHVLQLQTWTQIRVELVDGNLRLYAGDSPVVERAALAVKTGDLRAPNQNTEVNHVYIGRGVNGTDPMLAGRIGSFVVHRVE